MVPVRYWGASSWGGSWLIIISRTPIHLALLAVAVSRRPRMPVRFRSSRIRLGSPVRFRLSLPGTASQVLPSVVYSSLQAAKVSAILPDRPVRKAASLTVMGRLKVRPT